MVQVTFHLAVRELIITLSSGHSPLSEQSDRGDKFTMHNLTNVKETDGPAPDLTLHFSLSGLWVEAVDSVLLIDDDPRQEVSVVLGLLMQILPDCSVVKSQTFTCRWSGNICNSGPDVDQVT